MTTPQPAALPEHELRALYQRHELATTGLVLSDFKRIVSEALALQPQPAAAVSDEEIERIFKKCGGKWNGDHWVIEDADLHPAIREFLALRPQAVPMTEDAERLDWMATNEAHIGWNREGEVCRVWVVQDEEKGAEPLTVWHSSARAAIDEARGITAQGAQGEQG